MDNFEAYRTQADASMELIEGRQQIQRLKAPLAEALPYIMARTGQLNEWADLMKRIQQEIKPTTTHTRDEKGGE